jgi:glycosyltransferase involved in cell wall biosynthesis
LYFFFSVVKKLLLELFYAMLIAFIHEFKAFLPEIEAYREFFEKHGVKTTVARPNDQAVQHADVEWRFMGFSFRRNKAPLLIHEYASASLPPQRSFKDFIKSRFTVKPDFRFFLNEYVRSRFSFNDQVPCGLRDMGVRPEMLLPSSSGEKIYDFIYVGSISADIQPNRLLQVFTQPAMREKTLLIVSKSYESLQKRYSAFSNIIFKGPVPQKEVVHYIRQSSFAINYKPDIAPHSQQTSTKLLEYAACRVPVVTTDYLWMRKFQQQYGGNYFYLQPDLSNLRRTAVNNFEYSFPDLSEWTWEK